MAWLSENWLYLLLLLGVVALVSRRGGMGCGLMGMGGHRHGGARDGASDVDPVSGEPVSGDGAAVALYRGRLYHFNSRENRDLFEAEPARFVPPGGPQCHRHGQGHGCC